MVSLITEGRSVDDKGRPFPRRRSTPILALLAVLALLGTAVWVVVLTRSDSSSAPVACNAPTPSPDPAAPAPTPSGTTVERSTLRDVQPAVLSAAKVRVFNANGQGGQAATVAAELSDFGFASAPDVQVGNDPIYVDQNLQCQGQIRFGPNGLAAAASVALVAPCHELVEDARTDDTVDLALGSYFNDLQPSQDALTVVQTLADVPPGAPAPTVDMGVLDSARTARC